MALKTTNSQQSRKIVIFLEGGILKLIAIKRLLIVL